MYARRGWGGIEGNRRSSPGPPKEIFLRVETSFAKWLRETGDTPSAYAVRNGFFKQRLMLLAGISRAPQAITKFHYPTLAAISEESGIPIDTLIREANEAGKNPIAPRRYTRKEENDGKAAAE